MPHDLATTLLLVISEGDRTFVGQLGDGGVAISTGDRWASPTSPPTAEHANETVFVSSAEHARAAAVSTAVLESATDAVLVFSDGLERLALRLPEREPHVPFVKPFVDLVGREGESAREQIESFLQSSRLRSRSDDDCALVVCVRNPLS